MTKDSNMPNLIKHIKMKNVEKFIEQNSTNLKKVGKQE